MNKEMWIERFEELPVSDQKLILAAFPGILDRISDNTEIPYKLAKNVRTWLGKKKDFTCICPRCNGTGEYSFNQRDGKRCLKCVGTGRTLPRITKEYLRKVEKLV